MPVGPDKTCTQCWVVNTYLGQPLDELHGEELGLILVPFVLLFTCWSI